MRRSKTMIGMLVAALAVVSVPGALAEEEEEGGVVDTIVADQCEDMELSDTACDAVLAALGGMQRAGVSLREATEAEGEPVEVEIADFYFNARVTVIADDSDVVFRNGNAPGGNTHSVISSDWGGTEPVLPVPGIDFGGGKGFRSAKLGPGLEFALHVDTATMNPAAMVRLGTDAESDVLVPFHCYIHGPNVMNGWLLVHHEE